MTPLVIGMPAVVAVIVLAVVIGLHLIKKSERARLGDPPPGKDEPWREPARPKRPTAGGDQRSAKVPVPVAVAAPAADGERRPARVPALMPAPVPAPAPAPARDQVPAAVAAGTVTAAPRRPSPEQRAMAEQHRSPPAAERRPADGPPVDPG